MFSTTDQGFDNLMQSVNVVTILIINDLTYYTSKPVK